MNTRCSNIRRLRRSQSSCEERIASGRRCAAVRHEEIQGPLLVAGSFPFSHEHVRHLAEKPPNLHRGSQVALTGRCTTWRLFVKVGGRPHWCRYKRLYPPRKPYKSMAGSLRSGHAKRYRFGNSSVQRPFLKDGHYSSKSRELLIRSASEISTRQAPHHCTLRMVDALTLPAVAVMVVVPVAKPWARPRFVLSFVIGATEGADELQTTEFSCCWLPSSNVPIAANCWVLSTACAGEAGVIDMDTSPAGVSEAGSGRYSSADIAPVLS